MSHLGSGGHKVRRFVILGCGGFIGSHLLDALLADPKNSVEGFDLDQRKIENYLSRPGFRFHRGSIHEAQQGGDLEKAIEAADVIINLAAICNPSEYNKRPLDVMRHNCLYAIPLLELCARLNKWIIHFSTSEVYGRTISSYVNGGDYPDVELFEQDEDKTPLVMGAIRNQRWSYASAKQLAERYIFALHEEQALPFTIVRPFNFFGPRMDYIPGRDGEGVPRVLACFMRALLDGTPIQLVDGGTARRTITSIHDAIDALKLMLERPSKAQNQIFNIGNRENEVSMSELAMSVREIAAQVKGDVGIREHPTEYVSSLDFYGPGYEDCDRRLPNISKAKELLGWVPKRSLDDTLRETIEYYFEHYGPG